MHVLALFYAYVLYIFSLILLILLANLDEQYHRHRSLNDKICFVFHCEFSSHRGPKAYTKFRDLDRRVNELNYPRVTFKEIYLLDGGYKAFFTVYPVCNEHEIDEMVQV